MSRTRIYQAISLNIDAVVQLDKNASHHLMHVLRAKNGDPIILFNGQGGEYDSQIIKIDKKAVEVKVKKMISREVESPIDIYLAQGIARGEKMDFIIQKAVELGVRKIFPLITERCNVRLSGEREEKRLKHWQSVIISACEQSGRTIIPDIFAPQTLNKWLLHIQPHVGFVLSPHVQNKLPETSIAAGSSIALIIGPEGGLTDNEMDCAMQKNFLPLNLGPRVLRTETATIAALSVLQLKYGDV